MSIKFLIQFFLLILLTSSNVVALNSTELSQLLSNTDDIRTEDFERFSRNLEILSKHKETFSSFQLCYFSYLETYKLSLTGDFQIANDNFLDLFNNCNDIRIKIRTKALLANLYAIAGEYTNAISHLDFVISNLIKINENDLKTKYYAYVPALIVYDMVNQRDLSMKFAELLINEKPTEKYLCVGWLYKYKGLLDLSYENSLDNEIQDAIEKCKFAGEMIYAQALNLVWLKSKLNVAIEQYEFEYLLSELLASKEEIDSTKYKNLIGIKNALFAEIYEKLGNSESAFEFAQIAIDGSTTIGETEQRIDALQVLINYYVKKGDHKKANEFLLEKNEAEKKFYTDQQAKLMAYQTVKHDSLANDLQIESLNQRNALLQLEKELTDQSKTNQLLLIALLGIVILFLLILGYRIKKQQKLYKRLSERDPMTKIYNRKGIKDYMDYMLPYSQKKNEVVAYGIFDLDLFKRVNDQYGHAVGDWVIKTAIKTCRSLGHKRVDFARLGGEEFALIVNDSSFDEISRLSEEYRLAIVNISTLEDTGHDFTVSASFGITTTDISGFNYDDLMLNADTALYHAKNNGRNRVSFYQKGT